MKITMIVVISEDGFITKGTDPNPSSWSSPEDVAHYRASLREWPVLIMGSTTYRLAKSTLPKEPLKVVLSNETGTSAGNTRFIAGKPTDIVQKLSDEFDRALLLGGAVVFKDFLAANVVDEILLTVEPVKLEDGICLFEDWRSELAELGFQEKSRKPLNPTGTVLLCLEASNVHLPRKH